MFTGNLAFLNNNNNLIQVVRLLFYATLIFYWLAYAWDFPVGEALFFCALYTFLVATLVTFYGTACLASLRAALGSVAIFLGIAPMLLFLADTLAEIIITNLQEKPWVVILTPLQKLFEALFAIAPDMLPQFETIGRVAMTMRISGEDWLTLGHTALYVFPISACYFVIGSYFIRKRDNT